MSTENNVKNIREVAGRVNLLLLIDHGGRAGSNFFQCLFDQHQSLIFCPLVHYVYSYWDEQYYYPGKYPRMNVYTIAINVPGYRKIFGDDPDAFTNIFLVNEDETAFLYPDLVRNFWNI